MSYVDQPLPNIFTGGFTYFQPNIPRLFSHSISNPDTGRAKLELAQASASDIACNKFLHLGSFGRRHSAIANQVRYCVSRVEQLSAAE